MGISIQMSGIGDRLREERERLGMSQAIFGELGGVKANAQGNYENGTRFPDAGYLASLAAVGVDVLYVVTGERKPERADSISKAEANLLADYRRLTDSQRSHTSESIYAMAEMAGRFKVNGDK